MAQALQHSSTEEQLAFFAEAANAPASRRPVAPGSQPQPAGRHAAVPLCAGCRAREARYGFRRHEDDPSMDRPRTLCFECFRVELAHRQEVAARLARGWNASQVSLPLEDTLNELTRRRRRAQIAARHTLDL